MSRNGRAIGISVTIALVFCGIAFWKFYDRRSAQHPEKRLSNSRDAPSQTPVLTPEAPPPNAKAPVAADQLKSAESRLNAAFDTPIAFYGRVTDQNGSPVPEADVSLVANDNAFGKPSKYSVKTDGKGMFSVDGIHGITLSVVVSKPGYRAIPRDAAVVSSSGLFEYSVSAASVRPAHIPNSDSPVPFALHRVGPTGSLIHVGPRNFRIARNGVPLQINLGAPQTGHETILRCWNSVPSGGLETKKYDWRLEVSVPNGGLLIRQDKVSFEAAPDGYQKSDTIDMPAAGQSSEWQDSAQRSYYVRFEDGTFARADLQIQTGGDHFVVWESFLNSTPGDRNLEFDPAKQVKIGKR